MCAGKFSAHEEAERKESLSDASNFAREMAEERTRPDVAAHFEDKSRERKEDSSSSLLSRADCAEGKGSKQQQQQQQLKLK